MRRLPLALIFVSSFAFAYELDGQQLKVPHPVDFEAAKPALRPTSDDAITYVKGYLADKTYVSVMRIEVHADGVGDEAANQTLTEKRALAVARALVAKGVDCKRLLPVGFGSSKPVADPRTPEGRSQNRRVVFANAELRGHAIGGMPTDGGGKVAGSACN
ncbi:MAG: OmpA family protein [Kofleriaceae bacterium]